VYYWGMHAVLYLSAFFSAIALYGLMRYYPWRRYWRKGGNAFWCYILFVFGFVALAFVANVIAIANGPD
jgi:hypothetical protein